MKKTLLLTVALCVSSHAWATPSKNEVLNHYADLAHVMYEDSLITARELLNAVEALISHPSEEKMTAAPRVGWNGVSLRPVRRNCSSRDMCIMSSSGLIGCKKM